MEIDRSIFSTRFSSSDWVIVFIYILSIVTIALLVKRYVKSTADYMVSGRKIGLALNTASLTGTELGLVTIMYASIEGFNRGFSYLMIPLLAFIAAFIIGQSGFVISKLRQLKLTTIPEYFEKRFDKKVRVTSAFSLALAGILNMDLFPKMGATFVTYATGLASAGDSTLIVNLIMTILIVLVILYTVTSGMVAVIICDYIQFIVLSIGQLRELLQQRTPKLHNRHFCWVHRGSLFA